MPRVLVISMKNKKNEKEKKMLTTKEWTINKSRLVPIPLAQSP